MPDRLRRRSERVLIASLSVIITVLLPASSTSSQTRPDAGVVLAGAWLRAHERGAVRRGASLVREGAPRRVEGFEAKQGRE